MVSKFKTEADVAKPVVEWLLEQHWEIYQEVQFSPYGRVADIVAVRHKLMWIIEVKKTFSVSVLEQAYKWPVPLRSVAIPFAQNPRRMMERLAKEYFYVGVLQVGNKHQKDAVVEVQPAPLQRGSYKNSVEYMLPKLNENHKTFAEAGSNKRNHYTPYKGTMQEVRYFIKANPGCTIKDIYEKLGKCHYASKASMKSSIQTSLQKYENDWCKVDTSEKPFKFFMIERLFTTEGIEYYE